VPKIRTGVTIVSFLVFSGTATAQLPRTPLNGSAPVEQAGVSPCGLGKTWDDTESGYKMTWTRQGETNVFDVTGSVKGKDDFTPKQTITITGSIVTVERTEASDKNTCTFKGTIQNDGITVIGTYTCTKFRPSSGWQATINCK
jgi:hypothetical protein